LLFLERGKMKRSTATIDMHKLEAIWKSLLRERPNQILPPSESKFWQCPEEFSDQPLPNRERRN
jgi:hypothetical protein